jgi:phenylalanyl-tRNA synthetase beta chain
MKFSLNWLKDYVSLDGVSADEIARAITFLGFEVEGIENLGAPKLRDVFVGEVLTRDKHPNADKLSVCTVDVGPAGGVKTIVCGAQNYKVGDRVPVALPGAVLPGDFVIKQSKIRGQLSDGMMCSGKELGVGADHSGLLILADRPALGTPINDVLPGGDTVFDVEITPNRPDCLSHLGLARELAAWFRQPLRYPAVGGSHERERVDDQALAHARGHTEKAAAADPRPDLLKSVRVDAPEDCPLYTATVIAGIKVGPSPRWLQERLSAVGLRPINNLVDVGNYVMLEYGQPMHAFDAKKLGGGSIVVRHAKPGEKIVTLDGKERTLTERMLVIADAERPVVVAGVMGGENSGVDDTTTDLVLEVAIFKRQSTRATSKRLGLSSDSSYRYERGVDPHLLPEATRRAVDLILATAGGTRCGPTLTLGGDVPWQREISVTPRWVRAQLGFDIPDGDMKRAFEALELRVVREEDETPEAPKWTVAVPSWRDDLDRPIDLVEEVLRLSGTDKIPAAIVTAPGLLAEDDPVAVFTRRASDVLVGQSFNECVTYTLRSASELTAWAPASLAPALALANPFVEDQSHLRPSLVMGLLESLQLNRSRGVAVTRLFETGRIFLERDGQVQECVAVGFVIAEEDVQPSWLKREPADFYTTKRLVESVAAVAGVDVARQPLLSTPAPSLGWQAGHHALVGDLAQGWTARFGLLDLALVQSLGLSGKIYAGLFAILPEKLSTGEARRRYQPFSLFPPALRDLALVVDDAVSAGDVQKAIAKSARAAVGNAFVVERVQVFDVYRGQGLPAGKKSVAFSLTFRSAERTLTDDEVNTAFGRLQDDLTAAGYTIRR